MAVLSDSLKRLGINPEPLQNCSCASHVSPKGSCDLQGLSPSPDLNSATASKICEFVEPAARGINRCTPLTVPVATTVPAHVRLSARCCPIAGPASPSGVDVRFRTHLGVHLLQLGCWGTVRSGRNFCLGPTCEKGGVELLPTACSYR
jgi:hypothetical protein